VTRLSRKIKSAQLQAGITLEKPVEETCIDLYPQIFFPTSQKKLKLTIRNLLPGFILDVGCGTGWIDLVAKKQGFNVIAADLSADSLEMCRILQTAEGVVFPLFKANLIHMPFRNLTFDSIICCDVLEHINDPHKGLKELNRILKLSGRLCLTIPNKYGVNTFLHDYFMDSLIRPALVKLKLRKDLYSSVDQKLQKYHSHQFSPYNIKTMLVRSGFQVVKTYNLECFSPLFCVPYKFSKKEHVLAKITQTIDTKIVGFAPEVLASEWLIVCEKSPFHMMHERKDLR